jgi:hypothetical protein
VLADIAEIYGLQHIPFEIKKPDNTRIAPPVPVWYLFRYHAFVLLACQKDFDDHCQEPTFFPKHSGKVLFPDGKRDEGG